MAEHDKSRDTLVDEKQALGVYLESLLRDVPEADEPFVEIAPVTASVEPVASAPVVEVSEPERLPSMEPVFATEAVVETGPMVEIQPAIEPVEVVIPEVDSTIAVAEAQQVETQSQWEGRPEWAGESFQALLFKLSGLSMAIPLIELDGILEWPDSLTELPNRSPWYLGLLDNRGKTLPVIELAQLVLPQKLRDKHVVESGAALNRIILIGDSNWGIACDSVSEVVTLQPDEVRWRSSRTKRKWLAGTVIDHMCALLDAEGLVDLLGSGREEPAD
ncbi:MAG: chemotaxis protein CheW [Gammaproteobacteria bacterium]|nr:chemotaxis protein CheW [Gammaproteobacteria bacterium]